MPQSTNRPWCSTVSSRPSAWAPAPHHLVQPRRLGRAAPATSAHGSSDATRPMRGPNRPSGPSADRAATSRRTRSPSQPATNAARSASVQESALTTSAARPSIHGRRRPERPGRAERLGLLDRPVDVGPPGRRSVPVEVVLDGRPPVVQVHGQRVGDRGQPIEGQVEQRHVADRAERLGPQVGERPQAPSLPRGQHHPDQRRGRCCVTLRALRGRSCHTVSHGDPPVDEPIAAADALHGHVPALHQRGVRPASLGFNPITIVLAAIQVAAGFGIANEKRWGYILGVVVAVARRAAVRALAARPSTSARSSASASC